MNEQTYNKILSDCTLCPRNCHVNRVNGQTGYCGQTSVITAARAALHMWEEPCISGKAGSGAVFFSGCNMGCIFCQNYLIAHSEVQKGVTVQRLSEIFLELQEQNACNINLVTPTHFVPQIAVALTYAKNNGLNIPVVYNTSGYELPETLRMLDGLIDIYLPDCKYVSDKLSAQYSNAPDYFERCNDALHEMIRQTGAPAFYSPEDSSALTISATQYNELIEDLSSSDSIDDCQDYSGPLMKKGVIVRHLMLPGSFADSKNVIRYLYDTFGSKIYISIMNQYTPMEQAKIYPSLTRKISSDEYDALTDFAISLGIENGFIQGSDTASESFIPLFDYKGL